MNLLKTGSILRRLLIITPVVVGLIWVSLFMPAQRLSIEGIGMLSFETTVTLSVGYEVASASSGWVSPTGSVDGVWTDEPLAYDENTGTYAYGAVPKGDWSGYIEFSIDAIYCDKVRAWVDEGIVNVSEWEVWVYYSEAWNRIFFGSEPLYGQYVEFPIGSTESVTGMQLRAYSTKADSAGALVYEVDFNEVSLPDISNLPIEKAFGTVSESTDYWSKDSAPTWPLDNPECFFTVTNNGTNAVNISIKATNFTGGVGWTLVTTVPGQNEVRLTVWESGDGEVDGINLITSDSGFFSMRASSR